MADYGISLIAVVVGACLAPVIPGALKPLVARLQGRRGPGVLQPYRDLRRLWGRSRITPEPASVIYDLAPVVAATCAAAALCLLPLPGLEGLRVLGDDWLVLIAVLGLSRFVVGLSAWDTGNGFALMGAARELTFAVFAEALFIICIAALALAAGGTSLGTLASAATEPEAWRQVVRWAAVAGLALVLVAETGRRPIDNPETHLELTMVHEGPLLEYGGRDLALLKWAASVRAGIVIYLLAVVALPRPAEGGVAVVSILAWLFAIWLLLAVSESVQAKMRILRAPALLGAGIGLVLIGVAASLWGGLA